MYIALSASAAVSRMEGLVGSSTCTGYPGRVGGILLGRVKWEP